MCPDIYMSNLKAKYIGLWAVATSCSSTGIQITGGRLVFLQEPEPNQQPATRPQQEQELVLLDELFHGASYPTTRLCTLQNRRILRGRRCGSDAAACLLVTWARDALREPRSMAGSITRTWPVHQRSASACDRL